MVTSDLASFPGDVSPQKKKVSMGLASETIHFRGSND